ncbi:MAG: cyclic nucleotide-binding domain-containing protein [Bacillota bacterium]
MLKTDMGDLLTLLVELHKVPLFRSLNQDEQRMMAGAGQLLSCRKDRKIISRGESDDAFFVVLSGSLNLTVRDDAGREILLGTVSEGDYFGEEAVFADAVRVWDATVVSEEARLMRIARDGFLDFLRAYPAGGTKALLFMLHKMLVKYGAGATPDQSFFEQQMEGLLRIIR